MATMMYPTLTKSQSMRSKRKSAVELLAESKPFYVKSEIVRDTTQALPSRPNSNFGSYGTYNRSKSVNVTGQGINYRPTTLPQYMAVSPSRSLPPLTHRRSVHSGNSDMLQNKLRQLLVCDSAEELCVEQMAPLSPPAEYAQRCHKSLPDLHCRGEPSSNKSSNKSLSNRDSGGSSGHYTQRSEPAPPPRQFYPEMYGGRPGSIASFSFRLLLAELPMHCSKPKESLMKLFSILATIRKMLENLKQGLCEDGNPMEITESDRADSLRLWNGREARVMHSIINCALALKDYELAMELLGQLCERDGAPRHALLSALGRLHLQLGDIAGAEVCFNEAAEAKGGVPGVRELVDRGLLSVAQSQFDEAYGLFQQASTLEPSNIMILNNMGVCLLYGGHLKEAIAVLESAISSNPIHALHESLLLNLCTLYDMESSKGRMKKFALLRQISKYQADAPTTILEKLYG